MSRGGWNYLVFLNLLGIYGANRKTHYTAGWTIQGSFKPVGEVNKLGLQYAMLEPADPERKDILLEICEAFHPYLMRYLIMICRGHVPIIGVGKRHGEVNSDVKRFILYFLPKNLKPTRSNLSQIVRHFHLAFKGMDTEEIFEVLMSHLVAAVNSYDPHYKAKVKQVVEVINHELSRSKKFTVESVNQYVGFDCDRILRMLCRVGFLATHLKQNPARINQINTFSAL